MASIKVNDKFHSWQNKVTTLCGLTIPDNAISQLKPPDCMECRQKIRQKLPPYKWMNKDGYILCIDQMETMHLLNAANLLMRKVFYLQEVIDDRSQSISEDFYFDPGIGMALSSVNDIEESKIKKLSERTGAIITELAKRGCQIGIK